MPLISTIYKNPSNAFVAHDVTAPAAHNRRQRERALPIPRFISAELTKAIRVLQEGIAPGGDPTAKTHKALNILRQINHSVRKRADASGKR